MTSSCAHVHAHTHAQSNASLKVAFHRLEVFVKLRLMGSSVHTEVQPLKEERAVEIGADMLGEFFLYSIAASYILYEYFRSMRKDKLKQDSQDSNIVSLQKGMATLGTQLEQLRCRLEAMEKTKKTPSTTKS